VMMRGPAADDTGLCIPAKVEEVEEVEK